MIQYTCNHCKAVLETDDSLGMKEEACPLCKKVNHVPPSKQQKREREEQQKAIQRQLKAQQQREEAARRAEAERLEEEDKSQKRQQYLAAIEQAKANPGTPKIWYCQKNGQERGPIQEAMLQKWIDDGQLGPDDCVRTEEGNAWVRLRDIPERFHLPVTKTRTSAASNAARCPKCGSTNIQVVSHTETTGFGCGKGCLGSLLLGPFGWLCGLCGMGKGKSKILRICAGCGKKF